MFFKESLNLLLASHAVAGGCTNKETRPAGGIVMVDGKAIADGTVEFYPLGGGRTATATIRPDGTFIISYRKQGDGLPVGEYKVAVIGDKVINAKVIKRQDADDASGDLDVQVGGKLIHLVPKIYNSIQTTPLRQTVADVSETQYFEFNIPSGN